MSRLTGMKIQATLPDTDRLDAMPSICTVDQLVTASWPPHDDGPRHRRVRIASSWRDWYDAAALLHDFMTWIRAASGYDLFEMQHGLAAELDDLRRAYSDHGSAFFVADDGVAVCGTVALRRHDAGTAELKRMYVRPSARGGGHAGRLITAAIEHARATGVRVLWLESLRGVMDSAIALYGRHGFVEVDDGATTVEVDGLIRMEYRFHG